MGQHFLRSERALASIISAGELASDDTVLEIGPGEGVLTERLLASGSRVIAVEKDDMLYENLRVKFSQEIEAGKLTLIHEDILNFDLSQVEARGYKLIANIPYNITGAILEKFLSSDHQPSLVVLLVQKEVAERIAARDSKESILSISVKAYGKPLYIEKVLAGSFVPAPKVDSAIIKISEISKDFFTNIPEDKFFQLLKAGFGSKRKKLSSNLSNICEKERVQEAFQTLGLSENTRAEELSVEKWQRLAKLLLNI